MWLAKKKTRKPDWRGRPACPLNPAISGLRRGCGGAEAGFNSNWRGRMGPTFPDHPAIFPQLPRHSSASSLSLTPPQPRHSPATACCSPVTAPPFSGRDPQSCFPGREQQGPTKAVQAKFLFKISSGIKITEDINLVFSKEIKHVNTFLKLQRHHFGDQLDLSKTDFSTGQILFLKVDPMGFHLLQLTDFF